LVLDAEDLQFLEARFRSSHSIALLVRPFATKASVGGIFLRDESGFNGEASALEFPFRSAQLTPSKRGPEISAPAVAASRAQVVPIASRREIPVAPAPAPVPEFELPPQPPAASLTEPHSELLRVAAAETAGASPAIAEAHAQASPPPPPPSAPPPASVAVTPAAPAPLFGTFAPPEPAPAEAGESAAAKPSSRVPMLAGLLGAALLGFVLLFIYPGFWHHSQESPAGASQDASPLTLRVEHTGTDLLLTWNRESAAARNASRAVLSISDGERHENYNMDLPQLRTGSIVYSPLGGDVSFQMEVVGKNGSRTATETLRVLRTRPSPMPPEGPQSKSEKTSSLSVPNPQSSMPSGDTPDPAGDSLPAATEPRPASEPVKPFDPASLAARLRPAPVQDLAEVPTPAAGGPVTPKVDASLPFVGVPAAPAPPAAPRPSAVQSNAKADTVTGGQIQPAQLISRKEPEYPALARQMGAQGFVELSATIGTDGAVKAVKVISGHPLLSKAAEAAVMQWRYRPTMLNGVPVENETRITLNFIPRQ